MIGASPITTILRGDFASLVQSGSSNIACAPERACMLAFHAKYAIIEEHMQILSQENMKAHLALPLDLEFHPLTRERWSDLEKLFGASGAYAGCWCMWWRSTRSEFGKRGGQGNKEAFKAIVDTGEIPGLLAYAGGEPIAWCSVAPREAFPSLERSRTLKRVDDKPTWSVVCFFVAKPYRRLGLMVNLLQAAVIYAQERGAKIVEGYPIEAKESNLPSVSSFTGIASAFTEVGFVEVLRRSERRPIMRYFIEG